MSFLFQLIKLMETNGNGNAVYCSYVDMVIPAIKTCKGAIRPTTKLSISQPSSQLHTTNQSINQSAQQPIKQSVIQLINHRLTNNRIMKKK